MRELYFIDWDAAAEEIAVTINVIYSADHRPEFMFPRPGGRIRCRFARITSIPVVGQKILSGMWGQFQDIVFPVRLAGFDSSYFTINRNHGLTESIQLWLGFAFCRLDHHGSWDGPGHGRRVKAVIHEALGNIFDLNSGRFFELPQIDNALVGDEPVFAFVQNRIKWRQPTSDVIGVGDRDFG